MRVLCAPRIYFYFIEERTLRSWRLARPYFFENRRRVLPRTKSSAKRIEVGATDKRETKLKKPNFHAAVKHLPSVSSKIHGFAALCNLRSDSASMVTREINGGTNIDAELFRIFRTAIYSRKRSSALLVSPIGGAINGESLFIDLRFAKLQWSCEGEELA